MNYYSVYSTFVKCKRFCYWVHFARKLLLSCRLLLYINLQSQQHLAKCSDPNLIPSISTVCLFFLLFCFFLNVMTSIQEVNGVMCIHVGF